MNSDLLLLTAWRKTKTLEDVGSLKAAFSKSNFKTQLPRDISHSEGFLSFKDALKSFEFL